jgi:Uma2 family endonuclease
MSIEYETFADVLEHLGGIDPRRVRVSPPPGKATEKDVLRLLDQENRLFELVDGILVEKVTGFLESAVAMGLGARIGNYLDTNDLGFVAGADGTLRLMPKLVRIPDVSFISWEQLPSHEYPSEPIPTLYPDLAVEVLSEGNTEEEMQRKLRDYFLAGTRLVWFVDPEARVVDVYTSPDEPLTLKEGDILDGGDVLPGFALPLKDLFARVPRPKRRRRGHANGNVPSPRKRSRR